MVIIDTIPFMMNSLIPLLAIFGAKYLFLASIAIAGIYFLKVDKHIQKKIILCATITLPLILLVGMIANHIYQNPRPFVVDHFIPLIPHDPDNGFPSDHTLLVAAIAAIGTIFHRRLGALLWSIAILVAVSRVYVGVHHPIDVIGSIVIAILVTCLVYVVGKKKFPLFWKK